MSRPKRQSSPNVAVASIDELSPDPANVRAHPERNSRAVDASFRRFGAARSIVVDAKNVVRAGNQTLESARAAGVKDVLIVEPAPDQLVVVRSPDWSDSEATAYAIADNRSAEHATWIDDALAAQIRSLVSEGVDTADLGFTPDEVARLTEQAQAEVEEAAERLTAEDASEDSPKLKQFLEARAESKKRFLDKVDANFWVCLVFQSYDQKHEFLGALADVPVLYGMYVDGQRLAERIGIPVAPNVQKPFRSPVDQKLQRLTLHARAEDEASGDSDEG